MLNPQMFKPAYTRVRAPKATRKAYAATMEGNDRAMLCRRRNFRTASDAISYARRTHSRWTRLYQASLIMTTSIPA